MERSFINRILVVDDENEMRLMVQKHLRKVGYECESATNAHEGLTKLEQERFELVISDIMMEGMDGLEFMKEALSQNAALDFIIMTGYVGQYSYSDIIGAGASLHPAAVLHVMRSRRDESSR